jgi:hypothetical protein
MTGVKKTIKWSNFQPIFERKKGLSEKLGKTTAEKQHIGKNRSEIARRVV